LFDLMRKVSSSGCSDFSSWLSFFICLSLEPISKCSTNGKAIVEFYCSFA